MASTTSRIGDISAWWKLTHHRAPRSEGIVHSSPTVASRVSNLTHGWSRADRDQYLVLKKTRPCDGGADVANERCKDPVLALDSRRAGNVGLDRFGDYSIVITRLKRTRSLGPAPRVAVTNQRSDSRPSRFFPQRTTTTARKSSHGAARRPAPPPMYGRLRDALASLLVGATARQIARMAISIR
jgi:hypothetical protein